LPVADDRVLNVPIDRADADEASGAQRADHPGTSE
jgi:hypothetical protein